MNYSSGEASKELEEITKRFEGNRNLDEFCQGIVGVAEKLDTSPMFLYMQLAGYLNLKAHDGTFYQCEEAKSGEGDCGKCRHFIFEADKCIADSVITPVYRVLHPEYKPPHFERRGPIHLIEMKK